MAADLAQLTSMDDILFGPMATPWGDFTETHPTVEVAADRTALGLRRAEPRSDCGERPALTRGLAVALDTLATAHTLADANPASNRARNEAEEARHA